MSDEVDAPGIEDLDANAKFYGFEEDTGDVEIPEHLPVLALRGVVIFPSAIVPLPISRKPSLELVEEVLAGDRLLALVAQKDADEENPSRQSIHRRGTVGRLLKMLKYPDQSVRILVQGIRRVDVVDLEQKAPYFSGRVLSIEDTYGPEDELAARQSHLVNQFAKFVSLIPYLPDELQLVVMNIKDPGKVTDLISSNLNIGLDEKQELLNTSDIHSRMDRLIKIIGREIDMLELGSKIQSQVQTELAQNQKEFYLRQQLRAIQKELGESDPRGADLDELRQKLDEASLPPDARKAADSEMDRLRLIPPESAEHSVIRTYLEWLANLPWTQTSDDNLDIPHARAVLDEDHFGLDHVKDRILEYLAVRKLRKDPKSPIICFAGPPGVGKTSLGRSIAKAMGREFVRLSLGGVRDEAEIRGHRRTYVGSLPGRIIQSMRTAGTKNPLFILDEIDKIGADFRGDPASALLEVLDPEQNEKFSDHYLDVPFDLSQAIFLTTANQLEPIPHALRDRMEVIEISGYTEEQKLEIAVRHLVPRQIEENGLAAIEVSFETEALQAIIRNYTREGGLRNLEREIGRTCRKIARGVTEGESGPFLVDAAKVVELLGPAIFFSEVADRTPQIGVVTGLAYTAAGGDILFVESTRMPGKKGLTLTGSLGDVMKESAQTALSLIRSRAESLGVPRDFYEQSDLHIHVPAGAIPKDGPSAGVTIATSLASLLTERPVHPYVAMTGELTLRGAVLPIGGVKEKVLAAARAGITQVVLPERNRKDLHDLPENVRDQIKFTFASEIGEVLEVALEPKPTS
jgi:ATP-dependent Lon protease